MNKIVFFGNERLATGLSTTAPTLQALINAGYEITAVVVAQNDLGKSRKARQLEIVQLAEKHDIPVLSPAKPAEILNELKALDAEIGVLVAYGKIVPQSVIDIFRNGIVNIHPSLLPKHRGPTPLESVMLHGETETGVSLMQLAAKMDAGPVYAQQSVTLKGHETKQQLAERLSGVGAEMLISSLPAILECSLTPQPQNDAEATYDQLIQKADGQLNFTKSAQRLEREIRAYAGWPKSRITLGNIDVIITRAYSVPVNKPELKPGDITVDQGNILTIECGKGYLVIEALQPLNKKEMPIQAFLAGYGNLL